MKKGTLGDGQVGDISYGGREKNKNARLPGKSSTKGSSLDAF